MNSRNVYSLTARFCQLPLFICGFRPFFTLSLLTALIFVPIWLWVLVVNPTRPPMLGGWALWHGHELLMGFAGAATVGFLLTAVPEFTSSQPIRPPLLLLLTLLWICIRLSYFFSAYWGIWPAVCLSIFFWLIVLTNILPPTLYKEKGRHRSFALVMMVFVVVELCYLLALTDAKAAYPWLYLLVHLFMVLIVLAASRISMNVLNNKLQIDDNASTARAADQTPYLARLPRRQLAISAILLCAGTEFLLGNNAVTGWVALACMASIFNLLNDWHIGRALLQRYSLFLYVGYILMAAGYGALGLSYLGVSLLPAAARHILLIGTLGFFILTVMSIVGRIHSGLYLDYRRWLPLTLCTLLFVVLLRLAAGIFSLLSHWLVFTQIAVGLWCLIYLVFVLHFLPIFLTHRKDGQHGCAGPLK
ncbi:MAG TPA: NnrS family protein [Paenalcaligenes sp.]|nr:NnrS family protein [Paenalcaligenes sp.]